VSKWLTAAGLPGHLPPAGPAITDAQVAAMYRAEPISASEIARRLGIFTGRALAARQDFLAQVAAEYRACGSTAEVAKLHDCATNTVLRWLAQAGVTVPGRGQWTRKKSGRPENEAQ
jgi:hypothetical protein